MPRPYKTAYELADENVDSKTAYANYFYVDQSVATLNSPDLEFLDSLRNVDFAQYKVRIVGFIPFTSNYGNYNIISDGTLFKMSLKTTLGGEERYIRGQYSPMGFYNFAWKKNGSNFD